MPNRDTVLDMIMLKLSSEAIEELGLNTIRLALIFLVFCLQKSLIRRYYLQFFLLYFESKPSRLGHRQSLIRIWEVDPFGEPTSLHHIGFRRKIDNGQVVVFWAWQRATSLKILLLHKETTFFHRLRLFTQLSCLFCFLCGLLNSDLGHRRLRWLIILLVKLLRKLLSVEYALVLDT